MELSQNECKIPYSFCRKLPKFTFAMICLSFIPLLLVVQIVLVHSVFRKLTGETSDEVYSQLKKVQNAINNKSDPFCYHAASGTKNAFQRNAYAEYFSSGHHYNVLVYPFCLMVKELGNRLGNYFHELACAEASGLHFMTVHPQWDLVGAITGNSTKFKTDSRDSGSDSSAERGKLAFLQALPDVIVHSHPLDTVHATSKLNHVCKCNRYCWQNAHAPWVNHTSTIRSVMRKALNSYYDVVKGDNPITVIDPEVDITNADSTQITQLPLVPDTAIQYRCGDNIAFSYLYGILPFTAFDNRIPKDSKYIYVLSDHPTRAPHSPYTSRCKLILEKLLEYLKEKFPNSVIVVKRGGDLFLDMIRLANAKVTICSTSTYCFWPALTSDGNAYFPVTSLIAGADNLQLAPDFGKHFHWFDQPQIISSFKGIRPWTGIIDILMGKADAPK
jgi:hypothetical protein